MFLMIWKSLPKTVRVSIQLTFWVITFFALMSPINRTIFGSRRTAGSPHTHVPVPETRREKEQETISLQTDSDEGYPIRLVSVEEPLSDFAASELAPYYNELRDLNAESVLVEEIAKASFECKCFLPIGNSPRLKRLIVGRGQSPIEAMNRAISELKSTD